MWFDKGKYITSSRYEKRIRQCNRYRCRSHHQKRPQYHFHYRRCHASTGTQHSCTEPVFALEHPCKVEAFLH